MAVCNGCGGDCGCGSLSWLWQLVMVVTVFHSCGSRHGCGSLSWLWQFDMVVTNH